MGYILATNRTDHTRERKMSVVEMYRSPVNSHQRHSSPESRGSECGCQMAAMGRKLKDLESLVNAIMKLYNIVSPALR